MYSAGMMNRRIQVLAKADATDGKFGKGSGAETWTTVLTTWAAIDFSRGSKAMREGALDAYDTIMVRTRYNTKLTRQCRIKHIDTEYKIESFHADEQAGTIQITATEIQK